MHGAYWTLAPAEQEWANHPGCGHLMRARAGTQYSWHITGSVRGERQVSGRPARRQTGQARC